VTCKRQSAITRRLRRIHNAWHFRFALNLVFTAQWFRFGGRVAHHLTRRYVIFSSSERGCNA
ncbi:hypothetical protein FWP36_25165, partial [Vibrio parahaemolyticus]|nr:hypothetical protein [Vibrio parahaemolyticus]EGQ9712596.1 hypothetical protein [Vibrio parahaemolyticus]EGQ9799583.1 hypothetical protein [Vibrio parahaemolyticus]